MSIWKDSVAVVTGGASGLGAATARALADTGMKVALFDLNTDPHEKTNIIKDQPEEAERLKKLSDEFWKEVTVVDLEETPKAAPHLVFPLPG